MNKRQKLADDKRWKKFLKTWEFLSGDINWEQHGGMWTKRSSVDYSNDIWWVVRFDRVEDNIFNCSALLVKPLNDPKDALKCCGWKLDTNFDIVNDYDNEIVVKFKPYTTTETIFGGKAWGLALVEAAISYGTYAIMIDYNIEYTEKELLGNEDELAEQLRCKVIREAETMMADHTATEKKLNQPCNALGSTFRDCAMGDPLAGLRRKVETGDSLNISDQIVLKMFAASKGHTLGGKVETKLALAGKKLKGMVDDV